MEPRKPLPLAPTLSQMNPFHNFLPYFYKIRYNTKVKVRIKGKVVPVL
jgi:hypothetical protein